MDNFIHLILTRFNLAYNLANTQNINLVWLEQRAELFEKYCLPSLTRQTNQNFLWVLFLDERTPQAYLQRVQTWQDVCQQIRVVLLPPQEDYTPLYAQTTNELAKDYSYVLTTRFDSDDQLLPNTVERMQEIAQQLIATDRKDPLVISFRRGLQHFTKQNVDLLIDYPDNHFLSLLEEVQQEAKSALGYDHRYIATHIETKQYDKKTPRWVQVVHENNVANDFHRRLHPRPYRHNWHDYCVWAALYARHFRQVIRKITKKGCAN